MGTNVNFISLNWDIVLENHLGNYGYDYGIDGEKVEIDESENRLICASPINEINIINLAKVHGSSNWVYCDNCKKVFYRYNEKIAKSIYAGVYVSDIKLFYNPGTTPESLKSTIRKYGSKKLCPYCDCSVGSHIATFSYKKSFRTNVFMNTWQYAEKILNEANKWIFIGYSLPNADYEFKHMLKSAQIRTGNPKYIHAIVKNDKDSEDRFKTIFGQGNVKCFQDGLKGYINNGLEEML